MLHEPSGVIKMERITDEELVDSEGEREGTIERRGEAMGTVQIITSDSRGFGER